MLLTPLNCTLLLPQLLKRQRHAALITVSHKHHPDYSLILLDKQSSIPTKPRMVFQQLLESTQTTAWNNTQPYSLHTTFFSLLMILPPVQYNLTLLLEVIHSKITAMEEPPLLQSPPPPLLLPSPSCETSLSQFLLTLQAWLFN